VNLSKGYLLALVGLFAYLSLQLVLPFAQYVLAGVLIAFVLFPLQTRLERYVGPTIAAFALVAVAIVGVIVPFVIVAVVIAGDVVALLQEIDPETLQLAAIEERIEDEIGVEIDIAAQLADSAEQIGTILLEQTTAWFSALTHALVGLGVLLFLLYYLLKDGDNLMGWVRDVTPLPGDVQDELYDELNEVMWAVLAGHVLIAIIEGTIAGIGLFVTGVPNAAFWTFVMVILSLIPLIGAPLVWIPASIYLFVTGEPIMALGLAVYSAIVVGVSDDYLRPIVVDRFAEISPAVIIVGVLGGIYAFGIMGLFFGPVIVGALIATINVVNDTYDQLEDDSETT